MNRWIIKRLALMLAAAVMAAGSATISSAQAPPAEAEAGPAQAAEQPAAETDQETQAREKAEELAEQRELVAKIMDQARDYLVMVATRWDKDKGESPGDSYEIQRSIENKTSSEAMGIMLDPAKGLVLSPDKGYQTRFIDSVKGFTARGKEFPLQPYGFYLGFRGMLCKTDKWPGSKKPLPWFDGPVEAMTGLCLARLSRGRLGWDLTVWLGGGGRITQATDRKTDQELISETSGGLTFDDEGRPLGFRIPPLVSMAGSRFPWRATDVAKATLVTFKDFQEQKTARIEKFGKFAHEIKIVYRQPEEGEDNLEFEGEDRSSLTQYYYGYAVAPRHIFVPLKLEKIYIQRFKEITVRFNGTEVPAKFLGAYLNFGGFLIETEKAESPAVMPSEPVALPDVNRAVLTYLAERKFGTRRDTVWYNRISGYERGYKDVLWPRTQTPLTRGTLVMDFEGRPMGMSLIERRPEEEKKGEGNRSWRYRRRSGQLKLYRMDKLAEAFKNPQAHFDPNLKPTDQREEKRLAWLGVETQPVTPMLAEMLDDMASSEIVQKLTRRGQIGLRVTYVYEGSPADAAGIKPGAVLIEVAEEGQDDAIELKPRESYKSYSRYSRYSMASSTNRNNYLTKLLTRLGPGTKIALTYIEGTRKKSQDFTLAWAPYDYSSSNKFKDEKTGLTVKDLTYDVRAYLHLATDQPGVIVWKVEPGEKAAVARIFPSAILTELNGRPIKDADDYRKRIEAIQNTEGGGTAVIKILVMGKSRMVRIQFQ
ncbi:MAG: hypothetical protein GWP05_01725 [Anaerolineaceae bacterium]|nr:hypothetical protein [Anaerolineaceae bacterium]